MIWHCEANYLTCAVGHFFRWGKAGFAVDQRRVAGHMFLSCQQCRPSTFFFAILSDAPTPLATCYAIDRGQYDQWLNSVDDRLSSTHMLHLLSGPNGLSYHPNYREPVHG